MTIYLANFFIYFIIIMSKNDCSSDYDSFSTLCYCNKCLRERDSQRNCHCRTCRQKNIKIYDRCNCHRCHQQRTSPKKKCHNESHNDDQNVSQNEHQNVCKNDSHYDIDECKKGKVIVITIN